MNDKDEYLVYTSHTNDTFYFKNRKLHREDGPAIVGYKDKRKGTFAGLKDEALYTRVFEEVEPNEQNDEILFVAYHSDSSYYLDGVRFNSKQEMDAFRLNNLLDEKSSVKSTNQKLKV